MSEDRYKGYIPVSERIEQFYLKHPTGRILASIIEHDRDAGFVLVRAEVYRFIDEHTPAATGHAFEYKDSGYTQKTSYIEVGETSAVGRALAFLGFETKRGIASREEMEKHDRHNQSASVPQPKTNVEPIGRAAVPHVQRPSPTDELRAKIRAYYKVQEWDKDEIERDVIANLAKSQVKRESVKNLNELTHDELIVLFENLKLSGTIK